MEGNGCHQWLSWAAIENNLKAPVCEIYGAPAVRHENENSHVGVQLYLSR